MTASKSAILMTVFLFACDQKEEISKTTKPARNESPNNVLADQLKLANLEGKGKLVATIDTSEGKIECELLEEKAPVTVANYIGLATGTKEWAKGRRDMGMLSSGDTRPKVKEPAYNGTIFHRVVPGFMIQGGDANGDGSGEPGYVIPDEIWAGAKHDHAGQLCMANRGPNTNGAQFFITDGAPSHLDGGYTIFGDCAKSASVIHAIASAPTIPDGRENSKPVKPVVIKTVTIARVDPNAAPQPAQSAPAASASAPQASASTATSASASATNANGNAANATNANGNATNANGSAALGAPKASAASPKASASALKPVETVKK